MNQPNVVFLMVDQLSAKWLAAADAGVCTLANLQRLRAAGPTFTRVITSNPVCCPARATLATGLTTRGHGVLENGYQLDPKLPTFMQVLQRAGWRTGALGKVHLRPHFAGVRPDYGPYGFDVTHITEDVRGGGWLDWVAAMHPEHYEAVLATVWASHAPDFAAYGPEKIDLGERIRAIRADFQWATAEHPENTAANYTLPFPQEVSQTRWITAHAMRFLRETPAEKPLYAHISYVQPHGPFCPPAECLPCVDADKIPTPLPAEWAEDPHAPGELSRRKPHIPDNWRYARQLYFADLVHLDEQLGAVLDTLEQTGRLDNTYILFLADHGEMFFDHGLSGKEEKHYDACIRVPLIISGPGLARGAVRDELVQLEDICPTVLEMTGQRMPIMPTLGPYLKKAPDQIDILPGRSLLGLCRGERGGAWRRAAYCESYNHINTYGPQQWARTIRTARHRYTFYPDNGEQLFDLAADPDEQHNVVADPAFADIRRELRDQLVELIVLQDFPKTRRELFALGVH